MFLQPLYLLGVLLTVGINYILPATKRYIFLLLVSCLVIGSYNRESLVTLIALSGINYWLVRQLFRSKNSLYYCVGLSLNCLAILLFNYFTSSGHRLQFELNEVYFDAKGLILALGLSFYSIQHIAYFIDVHKNRIVPEQNFIRHLFSIAFFPKIISGPVCTMQELLPQTNGSKITNEQLCKGFHQLVLGLVKKMVLADRLAPCVSSVFDHNDAYPGITGLLGAAFFTVQLYFDFSGYSDMAIGTARMLGYDLKNNFNLPFRSASVAEFWRRWHISLISFFTRYIYYPLTFRFRQHKQTAAWFGIIITFLISGLWHGIGFSFICWALCHVVYLCFELSTKKIRFTLSTKISPGILHYTGLLLTFWAVCFSNIFFRSLSFPSAVHHLHKLLTDFMPNNWEAEVIAPLAVGGQQAEYFNLSTTLTLVLTYLIFEKRIEAFSLSAKINWAYLFVAVLLIVLFGVFNAGERFIYMQF